MNDLKEIVIFFKDITNFSALDVASDLKSRMPEILDPIIFPESDKNPIFIFNQNQDIKIEVDKKCVRLGLRSKYFKSLSTVVFDIVDAFESVGCSFNRIGYVTSIFLSEKYIDIYKKHYLNVDNLNDVLELNLSWYLKLQTSKVSLNCWEKIITNKLEFPDLLVQYDINTPVDKEITTDMKFIKEFFKVSEDFIESRML